ncbi:MAG: hypothetical protein LQ343_006736 [Gyalolechia ehrenbergii]|nr:MAG: hypothetical protein LQ343_006736 [Gyalolechia ehrenbergii]
MTNPYPNTLPPGPPNDGIPPGMTVSGNIPWSPQPGQPPFSAFHHPPPMTSARPEPPGGRFRGVPVEAEKVRALFPLKTTVFYVMDDTFMKGLLGGYLQPWEFSSGLKVSEFCLGLGVKGITECHFMGEHWWKKSQTIYAGDQRAQMRLEDLGWEGRGTKTGKGSPVGIEPLE